jgi:tetratricopeptide (TPR) repeat protein
MTGEPNEASAHNDRGREFAGEGRYDKAIEQFRLAYELWLKDRSKGRKLALCNWADALREQEHCDEAAEKRREAIRVDPEYPEAYSGLDRVLADQGLPGDRGIPPGGRAMAEEPVERPQARLVLLGRRALTRRSSNTARRTIWGGRSSPRNGKKP